MAEEAKKQEDTKKNKDDVDAMDLIVPNLYLGGIVAYGYLKDFKIECILNCAVEIRHDDEDIEEMKLSEYKHLRMDDIVSEKLSKYLDEGTAFIAKCVDEVKKPTLVHCMEGKSRSVSMVLGYLMKYQQWTLSDAYKHCKKQRGKIRPNKAFWKSLMQLEMELFNKNTVTMKTIPQGPKAHICPYCEKNCGTSAKYLARHVEKQHNAQKGGDNPLK